GFALAQKQTGKALKGLRQSGVRNVAFVLVELPRCKEAAGWNKHLVQLIDNGRLSDTGISRNHYQLRRAIRYDAVKGGEQGIDLACSPVQFLGYQYPVWNVFFAEREFVNVALRLPRRKAALKITLKAGCGLVALLRGLGEQLHDDVRDRGRGIQPFAWSGRHPRGMAMDPLHRIGSRERKTARQHLVER